MVVNLSSVRASEKSRLVAIRLASLTLRCMENWRRAAGGYDEAMILVAVVAITSEKFIRGGLPEHLEDLRIPLPTQELGRCSASSIAAATGLNRETARRKVADLVAKGFLVKVGRSAIMFRPGILQDGGTLQLIEQQLESFRRTADSLVRDGVLIVGTRD